MGNIIPSQEQVRRLYEAYLTDPRLSLITKEKARLIGLCGHKWVLDPKSGSISRMEPNIPPSVEGMLGLLDEQYQCIVQTDYSDPFEF